jgi:hypothetical protein
MTPWWGEYGFAKSDISISPWISRPREDNTVNSN